MQEALIALALRRAGFATTEAFAEAFGLSGNEAVEMALMPYLLGYDLWRVRPGDTYTKIAAATSSSVQALKAANPRLNPDRLEIGQLVVVPMDFPVVPTDTPMTSGLMHYVLRGLQARYPSLWLDSIGRTEYGRPLERVRLGTGSRGIYYNASHHANEWITTTVLLMCLEQYARAVAFGEEISGLDAGRIARETTLYLVPMVNPDGVDLVTGGATEQEVAAARAIAENYPAIPFPDGWKANLRGVDLNLNYPAKWDEAREIKFGQGFTGPAPRDYVGQSPLDQPESRAMFDTTEELSPNLVIAWHTQGEEIYWKFLDLVPEGARSLGMQMAIASGYRLEDVPYASSFAGYKDWFIQDFDRPGYTIEAGYGENPLPLSQLPDMFRDNLPIFLLGLTGGDPNFVEPEQPQQLQPEPQPEVMQTGAVMQQPEATRRAVQASAPHSGRFLPPQQGNAGLQPTWG